MPYTLNPLYLPNPGCLDDINTEYCQIADFQKEPKRSEIAKRIPKTPLSFQVGDQNPDSCSAERWKYPKHQGVEPKTLQYKQNKVLKRR